MPLIPLPVGVLAVPIRGEVTSEKVVCGCPMSQTTTLSAALDLYPRVRYVKRNAVRPPLPTPPVAPSQDRAVKGKLLRLDYFGLESRRDGIFQ